MRHRNQSEQSREFHPSNALPVPDFKMLIKNLRNKANLLEFMTESLCVDKQMIPENVTFTLGGTSRESGHTVVISNATVCTLDELSCSSRGGRHKNHGTFVVQRRLTWLHKSRGACYRYRYHHLKHVLLLLSGIASRAVGSN